MGQICSSCGHERQPGEGGVQTECPKCRFPYAWGPGGKPLRAKPAPKPNPPPAIPPAHPGLPVTATICPHCGSLGRARNTTPGSLAIEIVLWLCFLVPGIIYSLWRMSNKQMRCRSCGASGLLQVGTPRGRQLLAQYHPGETIAEPPRLLDSGQRKIAIGVGALFLAWAILPAPKSVAPPQQSDDALAPNPVTLSPERQAAARLQAERNAQIAQAQAQADAADAARAKAQQTAAAAVQQKLAAAESSARELCRERILATAKFPSSVNFHSLLGTTTARSGSFILVSIDFDAKNGLGNELPYQAICRVSGDGILLMEYQVGGR